MTAFVLGLAVGAFMYGFISAWIRSWLREWERKNGMPFFRVLKETDPDAEYYLPELRQQRMAARHDRQN